MTLRSLRCSKRSCVRAVLHGFFGPMAFVPCVAFRWLIPGPSSRGKNGISLPAGSGPWPCCYFGVSDSSSPSGHLCLSQLDTTSRFSGSSPPPQKKKNFSKGPPTRRIHWTVGFFPWWVSLRVLVLDPLRIFIPIHFTSFSCCCHFHHDRHSACDGRSGSTA